MTVNFYYTTIRPVLEYCAPVFHHALPAYLNEDIERIQKRALSIISCTCHVISGMSNDSLGLPTLYDRRNGLCRQLFDSITINPGHKLYHLLPPRKQSSYNKFKVSKVISFATFPYGTYVSDALLFMLCPRVVPKALKVSNKKSIDFIVRFLYIFFSFTTQGTYILMIVISFIF